MFGVSAGVLGRAIPAQPTERQGQFAQLLQDFQQFFEGEEDTGPALTPGLSNIVNASLRRRPNDTTVKDTMGKYSIPENIPHLKVPMTNPDVAEALHKGPSILDLNIRKCQLSVSKAMIPPLQWLHDFGEGNICSV